MDWLKEQFKITPEFMEGLKEVLRLGILAIVSLLITWLVQLPYEWANAIVVILRFIDKWMHEVGKTTENDGVSKGLTRF